MTRNFSAFTAGAVATALILVACDRGGDDAGTAASRGQEARTAQQAAPAPSRPDANAAPRGNAAPPPREALADTAITGKIKAAILEDPGMQGADVTVNTDHGVVTLAGLVKAPEQTAIASAHAQRQDGVMRVDNHLTIARQ